MAHGLRGEIDQRGRLAASRRAGPSTLGSPSRASRRARSTPASRAASTRSASCGASSPSTRSQPSNVREACSVLAWPRSVGSIVDLVLGGGEPVAGSQPEPFGLQRLGLLEQDEFVVGRELRMAAGAVAHRPQMFARQPARVRLGGDGREQLHRRSLPHPAAQAGAGRPGPFRGPRRGGQRAVLRPSTVRLELVQDRRRQRMDGVAQLLELEHHGRQFFSVDQLHVQ